MNKKILVMTTALALSLAGVSCNKSGKLAQPSTFAPPNGPMNLKLKWPKGEHILQEIGMKQNQDLFFPGRSIPIKQEITTDQEIGFTVLTENADGEHEVEMEFLSAKATMTFGEKALPNYDSTKKTVSDKANPLANLFGKIIGSKIRFFLDASNKVERVEGVDELREKLESLRGEAGLESFKNQFSEGNLRQMMATTLFLPQKAVQPGDTWPVHIEFPMDALGTMVVDNNFTFQNWEKHGERNCARLEFQGTITNKFDTGKSPGLMSVSITEGHASGASWFDPELGLIIDATANLDLNLEIALPLRSRENLNVVGKTQNITSHMNQILSSKLISVK